jgi:hypothetical protein
MARLPDLGALSPGETKELLIHVLSELSVTDVVDALKEQFGSDDLREIAAQLEE